MLDALADARTFVVNAPACRYGDALWTVLTAGSAAVVACLDGLDGLAALYARTAARAALRMVPGLRG